MKVKDLKALLEKAPDDAEILVPARDHSYRHATVELTTALFDRLGYVIAEDYGEESTPEKEYGKRRPVIVVN